MHTKKLWHCCGMMIESYSTFNYVLIHWWESNYAYLQVSHPCIKSENLEIVVGLLVRVIHSFSQSKAISGLLLKEFPLPCCRCHHHKCQHKTSINERCIDSSNENAMGELSITRQARSILEWHDLCQFCVTWLVGIFCYNDYVCVCVCVCVWILWVLLCAWFISLFVNKSIWWKTAHNIVLAGGSWRSSVPKEHIWFDYV
jgi:hypothetical protein